MHELSIVTSIIKTSEKEIVDKDERVLEIFLEIGKLSGIEIASLNFVWELATKGTVLQDSKVTIAQPEGKAKCLDCDFEYHLEKIYDSCTKCNSPFKNIISGKEFKINKLVISNR
jgi:hydrogenase nickel incorporation protein HypA/HybF